MPTSTWGGPEPDVDELYPSTLLKYFLKNMMLQFGAQGACIALFDESIGQMRIQAHVRLRSMQSSIAPPMVNQEGASLLKEQSGRVTINLLQDTHATAVQLPQRTRPLGAVADEVEDVTPQQSELFAVGSIYPRGRDLIGFTWHKNEVYTMQHEDYLGIFYANHPLPFHTDVTPTSYLLVPIREATLVEELRGHNPQPNVMGVIVLYQISPHGAGFPRQRNAVIQYVERIALYLQNYQLQRSQRRTSDYLQLLQGISRAFPTSVKLSDLVESMYQFTDRIVDVSSMLLTLYDRDLDRLYDVFAIRDGKRIADLAEQPLVRLKEERPVWWHMTQDERRTLVFSPAQDQTRAHEYVELLTGVWGDQRATESFLLLPMKMLNRVIGAISITSKLPNAYHPEEIQVLETMAQIVTVSIENTKLYERDRRILQEATQREAHLAAVNSALQSFSAVLNVTELLNNLVEAVARVLKVDMCAFFQLSTNKDALVAQALYAPSSVQMIDDGSGMPTLTPPRKGEPDKLINMIQLPFKDTFLEQMTHEGFSYLAPPQLDELAQKSDEAGAIFLRETNIYYMLIIPMTYQEEFLGFLAVPTPNGSRIFRPKDVGTLLAICAQAASAIRNAQLFGQREEAYAELERMSKLKDEFLVTASHELRTPLTAISGYSSQLKRQATRANPQQILRFATRIAVANQQLCDLVNSMTEAVQVGAMGKNLDLHIESVELRAAAEIAISMLSLNSEQHVAQDIPRDLWVSGDAACTRQVITNLLENATKYSPPESPISISASRMMLSEVEPLLSEDQIDHALLLEKGDISVILIRVTDHGEGVLPEDQLRIFEKFVRAPRSLTTAVRGTGLGLYICRRFIEAMEGKLWLERSVPNEGSTFSFYLPWVLPPVEDTLE